MKIGEKGAKLDKTDYGPAQGVSIHESKALVSAILALPTGKDHILGCVQTCAIRKLKGHRLKTKLTDRRKRFNFGDNN